MKYKDEAPENLGGLGGMLPAEVLKMLNELLEQLHRTNHSNNGSNITFVYVASGGQHVDHVENQYFGTDSQTHPILPCVGRETESGSLPEPLATEEAMSLWEKAKKAGYVDEHYNSLLSRTQSALLADVMAERLGIRKKWKTFEMLWKRKNMRSDYNLALSQQQSLEFQDELKRMLVA